MPGGADPLHVGAKEDGAEVPGLVGARKPGAVMYKVGAVPGGADMYGQREKIKNAE